MLFKSINCSTLHMNPGIMVEMNLQGMLVQTRKCFRFLDACEISGRYPKEGE